MSKRDITSCRGTLDFLKEQDELLVIKGEVDPICEVSGIIKALDNGPALLFENVKGYPNHRIVSGLFARRERVAKIFGVADSKKWEFKGIEAVKNPIPPEQVDTGPCQEVVITEDIDVLKIMPVIRYSETDAGRIIGGGNILIGGPDIGNCISYKRTHFRGKDWATLGFNPGSHFEYWVLERRKENRNLPLTINVCPSPAVQILAGTGSSGIAIPAGTDELAIAGGLQGAPVPVCKALTVDAYAIANAEWVIEGYIDTTQIAWESEEAEKTGSHLVPFFPEYHGHQGMCRPTYKFQATAVTYRKDSPIFYTPLAHGYEQFHMHPVINHALWYETLNRMCPGLVIDVNYPGAVAAGNGLAIQVRKRRRREEDYINNLILTAMTLSPRMRLVIVVDEDVDIYSADDIMWALCSRVDPNKDVMMIPPGTRVAGIRGEARGPTSPAWRMGIDATAPFEQKREYFRGEYPRVDLERWLTREEIAKVRAQQSEYAKVLAEKRA